MTTPSTELTQLNVRVPVGMIRVLDELAGASHLSRAHYLARLVKNAQVDAQDAHDAEVYRVHGQTKLGELVGEHALDLLAQARGDEPGTAQRDPGPPKRSA